MNMKKEKYLETMITISTGFTVLFLLFNVKTFIFIAAGIGLIAVFWKKAAMFISWLWFKLGEAMGFVSSKIILTLVFYVVLMPLALLSRLFKNDNLLLRKGSLNSIFFDVNRKYSPEDFEKMW
jgi:hypothetical protein